MRLKSCMISLGLKIAGECDKPKNYLTANTPHELIIIYVT